MLPNLEPNGIDKLTRLASLNKCKSKDLIRQLGIVEDSLQIIIEPLQ